MATTSQRASASSAAARPVCSFIARSSSGVTCRMRMRLEWKVKRSSGASGSRARISAGISVSIVTLELGTISAEAITACSRVGDRVDPFSVPAAWRAYAARAPAAATSAAAPPSARPARGPATCASQPTSGAPIGVEPRKTTE